MILTVTGFKGGAGKTTSAVHLAAFMQARGRVALIDGDDNRSATAWAQRGHLPFPVVDAQETGKAAREFEHLVIDTQARPTRSELQELVEGADILLLPSTPDALALHALTLTVNELRGLNARNVRILLCAIPPRPSRDGDEARAFLESEGLRVLKSQIRRLAAFSKAALAGSLVQDVRDPRAALGWTDYQKAGKELIR